MAFGNGIFLFIIFTFVSSRSIFSNDPVFGQPEQVHLSYGSTFKCFQCIRIPFVLFVFIILEDPSLMIVTWVTLNEVNESIVEYGIDEVFDRRVTGYVTIFQDGGTEKRREYIHRVVLKDLKPGQRYCMI